MVKAELQLTAQAFPENPGLHFAPSPAIFSEKNDNDKKTLDGHGAFSYVDGCWALVAQLDRATGYEPVGREFESLRAHHSRAKAYEDKPHKPFFLSSSDHAGASLFSTVLRPLLPFLPILHTSKRHALPLYGTGRGSRPAAPSRERSSVCKTIMQPATRPFR